MENKTEIFNDKGTQEEYLDDIGDILENYREQRLTEIKNQMNEMNNMKQDMHGTYQEITEAEFLPLTTQTRRVACHFYSTDFKSCKVLDSHLEKLAQKHFTTRFVKLNAPEAPFFVQKLKIKTLPCLVMFIDGKAVDRIVGFDELGNSTNFSTAVLERRLGSSGAIQVKAPLTERVIKTNHIVSRNVDDNDDD